MLRTLLIDRFKLTVHTETRQLPIYLLSLVRSDGKLRPQLRTSAADCRDRQEKSGVSPNGEWVAVVVAVRPSEQHSAEALAVPYDTMAVSTRPGVPMRKLCNGACRVDWSPDGRFLYVWAAASSTLVLAIANGQSRRIFRQKV